MLMRTDAFRELDRLSQQLFGGVGTAAKPSVMPMDAWRAGEEFVVQFDLPGVDPGSINLDTERIDAGYEAGVLTLRIPVAERAKPRKITIRTDETAGSRVLEHAPWP